ncbi:MAG: LamG domain-containing protein [Rhodospirillaceae bacterium]|nr:LamG domain-containing protein [Rhodospirillaceae bacterium]
MKSILTFLRRGLSGFGREAKRDDGALALIIAIALIAAAAALLATTVRQNKEAEVRRKAGGAETVKLLKNSIIGYYLSGTSGTAANRLPCPDTDLPPDGSGEDDETLNSGTYTCNSNTGVIPWRDLKINKEDAIDAYGNYYTYVVTGNATSRSVCTSVSNSYNSSQSEFAGTVESVSDTSVQPSGDSFYYAIISHGPNGLGAISGSGSARTAPNSASEIQNCPSSNSNCTDSTPLTIVSGPKDTSSTSSYFDDDVYLGSRKQLTELCEAKTPAGKVNAQVNEPFDGTAVGSMPSSLASAGTGSGTVAVAAGSGTNRVLQFIGVTGNSNAAVARTTSQFNPAERPQYISFEWSPTALDSNRAGISLGLRGTSTDRNSNQNSEGIFDGATDDGITIRYFEDTNNNANGSIANTIYICDDSTANCNSGSNIASSSTTFTIDLNATYFVEAYDDGTQIWARITRTAPTAGTPVTVQLTALPSLTRRDLAPDNYIFFINRRGSTSQLDNLLIARGSTAMEFDGTDDIVETTGSTAAHGTATGNLTLEAWVRPDTLPTGSNRATLISKYTDGATASSAQAYRLYMTSSGLGLELVGDDSAAGVTYTSETFSFGKILTTSTWTHVAVTYDGTSSTRRASLYIDGELEATAVSTAFGTNAINTGTAAFSVGAERNGSNTIVNEFDGQMTDVRVWNTTRTALQIFLNYNRRIPVNAAYVDTAGLLVNWTLDRDTTATTLPTFSTNATAARTAASTATALNGTFSPTSSTPYVGIYQRYIPALSTSFCTTGTGGTVVGAFTCEFRTTAQSTSVTLPNNLPAVHIKAWGAGGGGYYQGTGTYATSRYGGGGGYSAGKLRLLSSGNAVAGLTMSVDVGGGGTASASVNNGSGGGGASGIWYDTTTDVAGIIAGGGGGSSYGDDHPGGGLNCNTTGDCGPGAPGGGPAAFSSGLGHAPDVTNECGGRSFDEGFTGTPDGTNARCDGGGDDPSGKNGGGGAIGNGGSSLAGNGGSGYAGAVGTIGGGGGGGGVSNSAMTAGGAEAGGYDNVSADTGGSDGALGSGFGGGGGKGFADTSALSPYGVDASSYTPGGNTDPGYAGTGYCAASDTPCTLTPGQGGNSSSSSSGKPGAVIIKW